MTESSVRPLSLGLHLANAMALTLIAPFAPLLWLQGVHTRQKTVVLPEPPGPRSGRTGSGPMLRLLIAGDSAAAGVGVLSLGVNDVTGLVPLQRWVRQQRALVTLLKERFGVRHVLVGAVPPMGEMLAMPQPLRAVMGQRAALFNAALTQALRDQQHCQILHLPPSRLPGGCMRCRCRQRCG